MALERITASRGNAYFKSTFDVTEKRDFSVVYKIHDKARNRRKHPTDAHIEKDVADWEEAPVSVKLSQLVDHYLANETGSKELPNLAVLRALCFWPHTAIRRIEAPRRPLTH